MLQRGDVIMAETPFSDGSGSKRRPVVVLTKPNYYSDVLVAEVTSSKKPGSISLKYPRRAGLRQGSHVRRRIATIKVNTNTHPIGTLAKIDA